jgi:hypothetical protein
MRNAFLVTLLIFAALFVGCAATEKPSGSGEKGSPPPAVKPYE